MEENIIKSKKRIFKCIGTCSKTETEQEKRELSGMVPDTLAETERNILFEENRVNRKTRKLGMVT